MDELLAKQRTTLHNHILEVAKKYPRFSAKAYTHSKHQINQFRVATHVVNNRFIEVNVITEGETVLKIRHYHSCENTVNMVLNFINLNY